MSHQTLRQLIRGASSFDDALKALKEQFGIPRGRGINLIREHKPELFNRFMAKQHGVQTMQQPSRIQGFRFINT